MKILEKSQKNIAWGSVQNAIEADAYKFDPNRKEPKAFGVVPAYGFYYPYITQKNYTFIVLGEYKKEASAIKALERKGFYYDNTETNTSGERNNDSSTSDRNRQGNDILSDGGIEPTGEYRDIQELASGEQTNERQLSELRTDERQSSGTFSRRRLSLASNNNQNNIPPSTLERIKDKLQEKAGVKLTNEQIKDLLAMARGEDVDPNAIPTVKQTLLLVII